MHPFGGTPVCPRCSTAVYAAEQIMGPGRKYCLKCTSCSKRLDSFALVEHEEKPYCKICHVKLFGTRDLRHGNLYQPAPAPARSTTNPPPPPPMTRAISPPAPARASTDSFAQPVPVRRHQTGNAALDRKTFSPPPPPVPTSVLKPTRTLSPSKGMGLTTGTGSLALQALDELIEDFDAVEIVTPVHANEDRQADAAVGSNGNGNGKLPPAANANANGNGRYSTSIPVPLVPSMTGTRYGAALDRPFPAPPLPSSVPVPPPLAPTMTGRVWALGSTPKCPACAKSVYFAEQVKAVGKTWHKWCLRCRGCEKTLDTGRLVDKEGEPFCYTCYGKNFGPRGSGYALLGKAGG